MQDKKPTDRGVVDSIAALRELRYMTRGPGRFEGRKRAPATPTVKKLQAVVDKIPAKPKKAKKRRARR